MTLTLRRLPAIVAAGGIAFLAACSKDDGGADPIPPIGAQPPMLVAAGDVRTAAVKANGTLWRWGMNASTPGQVGTDLDWIGVAQGLYHACALKDGGSLWCWGYNDSGQFGTGGSDANWASDPVEAAGGGSWTFAAVGVQSTCGVRDEGSLWCWGNNAVGQLGDGTTTERLSPVAVSGGGEWSTVSMSLVGGRTCGVRNDGSLWCWGGGVSTPTRVDTGTSWARVTVDQLHACAIRQDGTLWCWGSNTYGQLGDGTQTSRAAPVRVGTDASWESVSACGSHTCAARTDGTLWCWGLNGYGQVGDGTTENRSTPTQVGTAATWAQVAAGSYFTCARQDDGSVWCWGNGIGGRLGDGSTDDHHAPVQAIGL